MKQYSDLLRKILGEGYKVPDRTSTGTVELFGEQIKFDIADGFPLLTGKATNFSIVEKELKWMLSGSTNVNDLDSSIWSGWREQYTLPREIVEVEPRPKEYEPYDFDLLGAATLGFDLKTPSGPADKLAGIWVGMMRRCYNPENDNYRFYGGKGVSVCKRWHQVANFIKDVQLLPHWAYKEADWDAFQLDKDYYSSNQYSPETCVWLRQDENSTYLGAATQVVDSCGTSKVFLSQAECAREYRIPTSSLHRYIEQGVPEQLSYRKQRLRGCTFAHHTPKTPLRYALIPEGCLGPLYGFQWRKLGVDQIEALVSGLKADPHSRRHIVDSWNVDMLHAMALTPCHSFFQVNVADGKINLHMYQRSADIFLGVPYNIAFYALLLELLAFELGLVAGVLTISYGSAHIYHNHMEQVAEYLSRGRHALPTLTVEKSDICAATFDVTLEGYSCGDKIPAPVAV